MWCTLDIIPRSSTFLTFQIKFAMKCELPKYMITISLIFYGDSYQWHNYYVYVCSNFEFHHFFPRKILVEKTATKYNFTELILQSKPRFNGPIEAGTFFPSAENQLGSDVGSKRCMYYKFTLLNLFWANTRS